MLNQIKKHKFVFLGLLILAVSFIIAAYFIFIQKEPEEPFTPISLPTPSSLEDGFIEGYVDEPINVIDESEVDGFAVMSVYPGTSYANIATFRQAIGFRLNFPINIRSVQFSSDPPIDYEIFEDEENYIVYIRPKTDWVLEQTYAINFSVESVSGRELEKNFTTTFIPIMRDFGDQVPLNEHK